MKKIIRNISLTLVAVSILSFTFIKVYASTIPIAPAVFETSIASPMAVGDSSMTLVSAKMLNGNNLSGYTCFTVDSGNPNLEFICGTVSGTTVSSLVRGVDPLDGKTSDAGLIFSHRRGADVKITDFPAFSIVRNIANGTDTFPNIISYGSAPTFTSGNQIITKTYGDSLISSGTMYIGTTSQALNRASAAEGLSGITGLTPGTDFTLTKNSVVPFTSVESGAVVNTLYLKAGQVGIGTSSPTAFLTLPAGTASAGTAPLKLTSGTNLSTTEAGAIEYNGSHLYFSASNGGTRYQLDQQSPASGITIGTSPITSGSSGNVLYHTAGNVIGEMTTSGSGTVLALTNSPVFTTPNIGSATGSISGNAGTATYLAGGLGGQIPYQSAASTTQFLTNGNAGQILQSAGGTSAPAWSTPTYPSASATSGKILKSDGTNFVASTETYATPGTSGNVMTSDGTNWTSIAPSTSTFVAGASITAGQPVTNYWYQSDGGITLDAKDSASVGGVSSVTKSFTVGSHSNMALVVGITSDSVPTSVTYNGVSMGSAVQSQSLTTNSMVLYIYYLNAPATGTHDLVANFTGSANGGIVISSYYNVKQSAQPEVSQKTVNASGNATNSITTTANGALVVALGGVSAGGGSGTIQTISNATNNIKTQAGGGGNFSYTYISDSGIIYPGAQTFTQATTNNIGGSNIYIGLIQISLAPFTTPVQAVVPSSSATTTIVQNKYTSFVGFANSSVSAGANESVTLFGIVSGLSGLTPNSIYYLNDSSGTIGTSAGTNSKKVGVALTATTLLIENS